MTPLRGGSCTSNFEAWRARAQKDTEILHNGSFSNGSRRGSNRAPNGKSLLEGALPLSLLVNFEMRTNSTFIFVLLEEKRSSYPPNRFRCMTILIIRASEWKTFHPNLERQGPRRRFGGDAKVTERETKMVLAFRRQCRQTFSSRTLFANFLVWQFWRIFHLET